MKRYTHYFGKRKVSIQADDYRELLERFDPGTITSATERTREPFLCIAKSSCPLCMQFLRWGCKGCTFRKFASHLEGCMVLLDRVAELTDHANVYPDRITWPPSNGKKVLKAFRKIHKELLKFKEEG